jgi:hypothetical protein
MASSRIATSAAASLCNTTAFSRWSVSGHSARQSDRARTWADGRRAHRPRCVGVPSPSSFLLLPAAFCSTSGTPPPAELGPACASEVAAQRRSESGGFRRIENVALSGPVHRPGATTEVPRPGGWPAVRRSPRGREGRRRVGQRGARRGHAGARWRGTAQARRNNQPRQIEPTQLRNLYAGSDVVVTPSVPTRDFLEPWGAGGRRSLPPGSTRDRPRRSWSRGRRPRTA